MMLSSSAIVAFPRRLTSSAFRASSASAASSFLVNRKCVFSSNAVVKRLGTLRVVGPDGVGLWAASTQVLNHHGCKI